MANIQQSFQLSSVSQDQPSSQLPYMQQPTTSTTYLTHNHHSTRTTCNTDAKSRRHYRSHNRNELASFYWLRILKLNYSTPTNNNQRISSNPRNRQIAQGYEYGPRQTYADGGAMVGNQFRHMLGRMLGIRMGITNQNPNGNGNVVAARAEGNATGNNGNQIRCYNCRGLGHLARNCTVRPRRRDAAYLQTQLLIAQKEEAGIQLQAEEFDLMAAAADLDEIEEVNANCILMANLQQASTSGTQTDKAPVYDSDGSAEVHNYDNCYDNEIFNMFTQEEQYTELLEPIPEPHQVQQNDSNVISEISSVEQEGGTVDQHPATVEETRAYFEISLYNNLALEVEKPKTLELEIERLLRAVVSQDIMSIVQNPSVVESSNLQTELDRTKERFENCIIKKENEYAKLWNDWYKKCEECKYGQTSYDNAYNDMHNKSFERLQAVGRPKGIRVSEQVDTTKGTSTNTKFANQSTERKPSLQPVRKNLVVRQPNAFQSEHTTSSKNRVPQKVDETNDLSKPVTSNSVPTPQESKIVKHDNVIAPGMFRINPFKPSREEKYVPNKVRASVRTNPIIVSQPHVVTKKDVNSDSNGLSSTGVDNTAKTRRP
ncbi:retrovirus-related pol polyprotein from transposon TNT 1-94 [Tanacetum coccineum]